MPISIKTHTKEGKSRREYLRLIRILKPVDLDSLCFVFLPAIQTVANELPYPNVFDVILFLVSKNALLLSIDRFFAVGAFGRSFGLTRRRYLDQLSLFPEMPYFDGQAST
jgi:hypothetical protein